MYKYLLGNLAILCCAATCFAVSGCTVEVDEGPVEDAAEEIDESLSED